MYPRSISSKDPGDTMKWAPFKEICPPATPDPLDMCAELFVQGYQDS
jgi:hypothetical protein